MSVTQLWWLSLTIFAAVAGVLVWLLRQIIAAARSVDGHAADIWIAGKQIAGNTVSIWMFEQTLKHTERMTESVRSLNKTAKSMDDTLHTLAGTHREEG